MKTKLRILISIVLLGLAAHLSAQVQSGPPKRPSVHKQEADDLSQMKDDVAKMQSLLDQMQAVFPLVGNPTSPANHELELNVDMWRILVKQMQRRVERMEATRSDE